MRRLRRRSCEITRFEWIDHIFPLQVLKMYGPSLKFGSL